jgi:hypothetical protein
MTCQSSRDDYVHAVADLCEMTRHLLDLQESYATALNNGSFLRCDDIRRQWELYLSGISRLMTEERAAYETYTHAQEHHSPRGSTLEAGR